MSLGAVHVNGAARLLQDAIREREAEAGTASAIFRGEKRLEHAFARFRRDAGSGVGGTDADVATSHQRRRTRITVGEIERAGG